MRLAFYCHMLALKTLLPMLQIAPLATATRGGGALLCPQRAMEGVLGRCRPRAVLHGF